MLDCDWSAKTKAKFFRLTRIMNDSLDVPLTATIRLHQYANPKGTGVPPADRGMLMPYNVGQITAQGDGNSIFDLSIAEPYFTSSSPYPLPLDIGLPAFSWGVHAGFRYWIDPSVSIDIEPRVSFTSLDESLGGDQSVFDLLIGLSVKL
jgi:hypothetical protein